MLASSQIPDRYHGWNSAHGAPAGRDLKLSPWQKFFLSTEQIDARRGPFAMQPNNSTRTFEYPWAFDAGQLQPGMKVLEIGGGLSGFQFALGRFGCRVVNVDPGMAAHGVGWPCDQKTIRLMNARFGTDVELRNTTVDRAELPDAAFDRAYSISVLEHLPADEIPGVMAHVYRCLIPGGLFILTVDLFLNLFPFTSRPGNEFGVNQNICDLTRSQPWLLKTGKREELFGFPEFDKERILSGLEKYLVGHHYPALAQCLVLEKPAKN
ncbi:MAG TPA: methyltransferase domain-containing protein [Verrucomicrobiae bacterium]|nr:methyltransferase domain-containing protein [Verrucomicrobiae bacterium]